MTARINCNDKLWKTFAEQAARDGRDVILVNLDDVDDGQFCERLAAAHAMRFSIHPETGYGMLNRVNGSGMTQVL